MKRVFADCVMRLLIVMEEHQMKTLYSVYVDMAETRVSWDLKITNTGRFPYRPVEMGWWGNGRNPVGLGICTESWKAPRFGSTDADVVALEDIVKYRETSAGFWADRRLERSVVGLDYGTTL